MTFRIKASLTGLIFTCLPVLLVGTIDCAAEVDHGKRAPKREADTGKHRDSRERGKGHMDRFMGFKNVDTNQDGFLSFLEFSTMTRLRDMEESKRRKLFEFLDRNKDGKIHIQEIQPREPKWIAPLKKDFAQLDVDKNGSIDLSEFSKLAPFIGKKPELVKKCFTRTDRNQNGMIERPELKLMPRHRARPVIDFSKYDDNSSGGLDFQEYSRIPWMDRIPEPRRKKLFDHIDQDNSGEISPREIKAAHKSKYHPHRGHSGKPHRKLPGKHRGNAPNSDPDDNENFPPIKRPTVPSADPS